MSVLLPGAVVDRAAEGLLGAGERLARELGVEHISVVLGDDAILDRAVVRCDRVMRAEMVSGYQPEQCLSTLVAICSTCEAAAVLLGPDTYSQEIAPRLGHRLGGCSIGDAQRIQVEEGKIRIRRGVYGGKAVATIQANSAPAVVWIRARAFAPGAARDHPAPVESADIAESGPAATKIVARHEMESTGTRLEEADLIVSGGRGLGGPEPFEDLRALARCIGAELAASRAACDSGWVPPGLQVGQTGRKVAPELYLAVAISGASQHLMGIGDARVVAAINIDADAPIFRRCQFGLVADYRDVIGPLIEQIGSLESG